MNNANKSIISYKFITLTINLKIMKKITLSLLVFLTIPCSLLAQNLSISFEAAEGFTLGEINGQNNWTANPTYSPFVNIVDTQSTDGSHSLYFQDDPNGPVPNDGITGAISPSIDFDDVTFTADLFVESGANASEFDIILQSVASDALTSRTVFLDGNIIVVDAVPALQFVNIGTYTPDTWFELKVEHDFANGFIEYSIDDTVIHTGNIVNGTNIDQMLLFSSFNQTGIYIDNINFTTPNMNVEEFADFSIDIYPNPTVNLLYVETNQFDAIKSVEIFDITGRSYETILNSDNSINVESLSAGVYLLEVETGQQKQSKRFIKH